MDTTDNLGHSKRLLEELIFKNVIRLWNLEYIGQDPELNQWFFSLSWDNDDGLCSLMIFICLCNKSSVFWLPESEWGSEHTFRFAESISSLNVSLSNIYWNVLISN